MWLTVTAEPSSSPSHRTLLVRLHCPSRKEISEEKDVEREDDGEGRRGTSSADEALLERLGVRQDRRHFGRASEALKKLGEVGMMAS